MRAIVSNIRHKHLCLDQAKIERARKVLGAKTDTETIERALDFVLEEEARSKAALAAQSRFVRDGIEAGAVVRDVFGALEPDR